MPFRIRTKLVIAFLGIIFPFLLITGAISLYNMNIIHEGIQRVETISEEMHNLHRLQLALDRALMPANDYIISGDRRFFDEFRVRSLDVDERLGKMEEILARMEETPEAGEEKEILNDVRGMWEKVREISLRIFEIPDPVGNSDASTLMEEMDYKWAYPAMEKLGRWAEIDNKEYMEAHEGSERALRMVWMVMFAGAALLLGVGAVFAAVYSRRFTAPIVAIHKGADTIAKGDFKTRMKVKTGDEMEQCAEAINEMAAQLDGLYSNLEMQVEERTRELRHERDKLQTVFEAMEDGVYIVNRDYDIEYINPFLEREFGPWKGRKCYAYFHGRTEVCPWCPNQRVFAGETVHWEWQSPKNGKTYDLIDTPLKNPDGSVSKLEIFREFTEKKKVEEALRKSEEMLQLQIRRMPIGCITLDTNFTVLSWNPAAELIFGFTAEEAMGRHPHDFIVPEEGRPQVDEILRRLLEGDETAHSINRNLTRDGRTISCQWNNTPLKNDDGTVIGVLSMVQDITEREKMQWELRGREKALTAALEDLNISYAEIERSKNEWMETFDSISDPLFIHDRDFRVVRANRAYQDLAGMPFKEIIGRPYWEVFPKGEGPTGGCLSALELKEEEEEEEEVTDPSTGRINRVRYYPIFGGNEEWRHSIHVMEDVTGQRLAEGMLRHEMEVTSGLLKIAEKTSGITNLDKLIEEVVNGSQQLVESDICLLYVFEKDSGSFKPSHAVGLSNEQMTLFKMKYIDQNTFLVKEAVAAKHSLFFSDPLEKRGKEGEPSRSLSDVLRWIEGLAGMLVIPLVGRSGPVGMILAIYNNIKLFTERDYEIADGMSRQAVTSLEEARLYREAMERAMDLSRKIGTIKVMNEIDRSILSTLDPEHIIETSVMAVSRILPCDRATVMLSKEEGLRYAAGFGIDFMHKGDIIPYTDTSLSEAINVGGLQHVSNLEDEADLLPFERRLLEEGFKSHIGVPLMLKGEVTGILNVGSKREWAYGAEDLSTLENLADQISVALENSRLFLDLEELFISTIKVLSSAIDAKSPWTAGHSERVTSYALLMGQEMGLSGDELKDLELAGLLHDAGKIGTYEAILDKPGKLTDEELETVRKHPAKGAEMLAPIKQLKNIIPAICYHHENYDGTGYPEGLKGENIPFMARILAVADTYDAMKADRPYRTGRTMEFIVGEFRRCSGTQFDPKVVDIFLDISGDRGIPAKKAGKKETE